MSHAIVWFRRDLRLADNPALQAALDAGHVPVPVYIHAPDEDAPWDAGCWEQWTPGEAGALELLDKLTPEVMARIDAITQPLAD